LLRLNDCLVWASVERQRLKPGNHARYSAWDNYMSNGSNASAPIVAISDTVAAELGEIAYTTESAEVAVRTARILVEVKCNTFVGDQYVGVDGNLYSFPEE
jgi:hypothetical protein